MANGPLQTGFAVRPETSLGRTTLPKAARTAPTGLSASTRRRLEEEERRARQEQMRSRERAASMSRQRATSDLGGGGGFLSAATGVAGDILGSGFVQNIVSGEEFINTVGGFVGADDLGTDIREGLEEIPTVGKVLGFAFDVGAAPMTLLTAGMGGPAGAGLVAQTGRAAAAAGAATRTAGVATKVGTYATPLGSVASQGQRAGRIVKGVVQPIAGGGNVGQRLAAETAIGTAAETGAEIAGGGAYGLVGGIGAGLLGFRGIRAAQRRSLGRQVFGEAVTGAEVKGAVRGEARAEALDGTEAGRSLWWAEMAGRQKNYAPIVKTARAILSSPSAEFPEKLIKNTAESFIDQIREHGWKAIVGEGGLRKTIGQGARSLLDVLRDEADNMSAIMKATTRGMRSGLRPLLDIEPPTDRVVDAAEAASWTPTFKESTGITDPRTGKPATLYDVLEFADDAPVGAVPTEGSHYVRESKRSLLYGGEPERVRIREQEVLPEGAYREPGDVVPSRPIGTGRRELDPTGATEPIRTRVPEVSPVPYGVPHRPSYQNLYVDIEDGERGFGRRHVTFVDDEVMDQVLKMRGLAKKLQGTLDDHGVEYAQTRLLKGQFYFPRWTVKALGEWEKDPDAFVGSDNFLPREFTTFEEGYRLSIQDDAKFKYLDPFDALDHYADQVATQVKNTEVVRAIGMLTRPGMQVAKGVETKKIDPAIRLRLGDAGKLLPDAAVFEPGMSKRLNKVFRSPSDPYSIVKWAQITNAALKPVKASFDMSAAFVTLGMMAYNNPEIFFKAFGSAALDMTGGSRKPLLYGEAGERGARRVDDFLTDPRTLAAAGDVTLIDPFDPKRLAEQMGTGASANRLGAVGRKIKGMTAPFDRNFAQMGNRFRVEMYHAAVDTQERAFRSGARNTLGREVATGVNLVDRSARRELGRAIDRATGISTARPGTIEQTMLFAPGFYRSMIETTLNAVADGGLEGDLARQYLGTFVSGALFFGTAAAIYQGRDPAEVLQLFNEDALRRGQIRLNPNFGSVRTGPLSLGPLGEIPFGERDISLFGAWDSNARIVASAGDAVVQMADEFGEHGIQGDWKVLQDFLQATARQKGSPAVTMAANLKLGETFTGKEFLTPTGLATSVLPFNISAATEDIQDNEELDSILTGFFLNSAGMKEIALSPTDRLNQIAYDQEGKLFRDLTHVKQDKILEANPNIAKSREAKLAQIDTPEGDFINWMKEEREKLRAEELRIHSAYFEDMDGRWAPEDFRNSIRRARSAHYAVLDQRRIEMGVEFYQEKGTAGAALSEWYRLYELSTDDLGRIDWDVYEEELATLHARIDEGEFGDPEEAREFIDERREFKVHADLQWFEDNSDYIRETKHSGYSYWEQSNRAFLKYRDAARRSSGGHDIRNFNELERAVRIAIEEDDMRKASRLDSLLSKVRSLRGKYRMQMRRKDPRLDQALRENGYVTAKPR